MAVIKAHQRDIDTKISKSITAIYNKGINQYTQQYRESVDNGYIFQPVALEVQGSSGESSEIFITRLCKMLCRSHDDQRAGSFLKQRISMALQIGNAASVLGTVSDRDAFEEIYYI